MSVMAMPNAWGQSRPVVPGDMWVYKQTTEAPGQAPSSDTWRFRAAYRTKEGKLAVLAAPAKLAGPNVLWKIVYLLNDDVCTLDVANGESLGLKHSCDTPLKVDMAWESGSAERQSRMHERYQVLAQEKVQVPAGSYEAFKIDSVGTVDGKRFHTIFWYAPEVKGMIKIVRENFDASGRISQQLTEELMPAGADPSGTRP